MPLSGEIFEITASLIKENWMSSCPSWFYMLTSEWSSQISIVYKLIHPKGVILKLI